jgi:DNA repair exonuclease SbcCD ATPase subunit
MFRLTRVRFENFMSVVDAELMFPEHGLVFVSGVNTANVGRFDSIGSGKTLVGEAISRALFGIGGRYNQAGHYSRNEEGKMHVRVEGTFTGSTDPLIVDWAYKHPDFSKAGEAVRLTVGGHVIELADMRRTREQIIAQLQVSPELSRWTVFLLGDVLKFNKLSEADAVDLLMAALNQPPWHELHARAKIVRDRFDTALTATRGALRATEKMVADLAVSVETARLACITEENKYVAASDAYNTEHARLCAAVTEIHGRADVIRAAQADLRALIKQHEQDNADEFARLSGIRDDLSNKLTAARVFKAQRDGEVSALNNTIRTHERTLAQLRDRTCPTCGQGIKGDSTAAEETQEQITAARVSLAAVDKLLNELAADVKHHTAEQTAVVGQLADLKAGSQVTQLSQQYEDHERELTRSFSELKKSEKAVNDLVKPSPSAAERANAVHNERISALAHAKKQVTEHARQATDDEEATKVAGYWVKGYSPAGIPNMVLESKIDPLNVVSRAVSDLMTGGVIQVSYSTRRELVSGDERPKLSIKVDNQQGARRLEGNSRGERCLANLIVAETLAEVGGVANRVGYRWYDEVTDGQDAAVRRSMFAYFKEQARRHKILIFVVDHSPEVSQFADYVLVAEKTQDGTALKWG